jgi:hypothetical protein
MKSILTVGSLKHGRLTMTTSDSSLHQLLSSLTEHANMAVQTNLPDTGQMPTGSDVVLIRPSDTQEQGGC